MCGNMFKNKFDRKQTIEDLFLFLFVLFNRYYEFGNYYFYLVLGGKFSLVFVITHGTDKILWSPAF